MNKFNSILGFSVNKQDVIEKVSLDYIEKNPFQPRYHFDKQQLQELASSIKQYGILQPIILKKISSKEYIIIAGERRFRAAKIAGLSEIPAIIRDFDENEMAEIAIIENLQRENLNYFEEAEGFKNLIEKFNLTQEEVAKKVGKSQSLVANKLRLLRFTPKVMKEISTEILTERHLRALLRIANEEEQLATIGKIYENNLNVKQTEELINGMINKKDKKPSLALDSKKNSFSDYRLFQNTIKKAIKDIEFAGVKTEYKDKIHEDHIEITVKIYK